MKRKQPVRDVTALARDVLGYLNFSAGASDPQFLRKLNELFAAVDGKPVWRAVHERLRAELASMRGASDAFRQVEQAEAVLALVFDKALPAYREFHRDLLFHQSEESLFQPFFVGRACEAVLQQGGPWQESERIVPAAIRRLNDYIGHRPVAALRTERKIQPYEHEWVRPIPLWIRGAEVAVGPYTELVETALAIIESTDEALLFDADFNLEQLDELAYDPRAYDFDHPVSKRPNYLFGQWDMNVLDGAGLSRRFVVQQVTLDALLERLAKRGRLPRMQIVFEEAAVLAGTMLMGSGVSGNRPDAHDSTVTLANLLPKIAVYRNDFYKMILANLKGSHADRLRKEAKHLRQPLGGARQHFNHFISQRRAQQLQHVHLAQLFASIGCEEEAEHHAAIVPTPSARMACEMNCRMALAGLALDRGRLEEAAAQLPPIEDLLHRAIECGAMVDPWNILGFGGQYSLFPAVENSIYDHRVDDLLDTMSDIFMLYGQIHRAAAAAGETALQQMLSTNLAQLARWWDRFATVEVGSVEGISGQETLDSAESVAAAIVAWHEGGAAAGDVAFWREHIKHFRSPKAYALVVDTLLEHRDFVAAMGLLVQWLGRADEIPLVEEDYSFHDLAMAWLEELWETDDERAARKPPSKKNRRERRRTTTPQTPAVPPEQRWTLTRKYLDYLEANAEDYWQAPRFEMAAEALGESNPRDDEDYGELDEGDEFDADDEDDLFGAAYENVTYRDTADDGIEGEMFESGPSDTDFELVGEAERIVSRLNFLATVAQLWVLGATASAGPSPAGREEALAGWLDQATKNQRQLIDLLESVHRHRIPPPRGSQDSMMEYDRRRSIKEALLEEIIQTCVETADAARMIRASMDKPPPNETAEAWERVADKAMSALLRGDVSGLKNAWPPLLAELGKRPLLYMALVRDGNPKRIVAARGRLRVIRRLLNCLPRLGLLSDAFALLETAQQMEARHPVGPGAITEFDAVFDAGCRAIAQCLAVSADQWGAKADNELVLYLEEVIDVLMRCWLNHSRRVRLSVLETVADREQWRGLKQFIQRYGGDLFTQSFMNLGNLRGIIQQGTASYLKNLFNEPDADETPRLIDDLDEAIPFDEAARWLGVAVEATLENYGKYVDYNSITTQSDRGDMLYTLLDFLRLESDYNRMAWNLRPVMLVHQVLVRRGKRRAADVWRRAVAERTAPPADEYLARFERLADKYGMRLPSVAERLAERFIMPLEIDRLCELIRPVVDALRDGRRPRALDELKKRIDRFSSLPSGAGYEVPDWIEALEEELDHIRHSWGDDDDDFEPYIRLPQVRLSPAELHEHIEKMYGDDLQRRFGNWP
ncbi:MAG: hypothetical protein JW959_07815 [Pirellulales bacterium]|nr:hypothetical protein [Pirellulales bacterium]